VWIGGGGSTVMNHGQMGQMACSLSYPGTFSRLGLVLRHQMLDCCFVPGAFCTAQLGHKLVGISASD
jgi:hypothetical protein